MTQDIVKIALTGKMRAGKDAVASRLLTDHGFELPIAFGTALKRVAHEAFPWVESTPKPRELYQFMNVLREHDPDVWIKHLERRYRYIAGQRATRGIVITDVRQANELAWCKANGFTVVRVEAPMDVRIARAHAAGDAFDYEALTHPTELEVEGFAVDAVILNDGGLGELHAKVDALVAGLVEH